MDCGDELCMILMRETIATPLILALYLVPVPPAMSQSVFTLQRDCAKTPFHHISSLPPNLHDLGGNTQFSS